MKHFIGVNNPGKSDADMSRMRDSYIKELRENANATPFTTSEVVGAGWSTLRPLIQGIAMAFGTYKTVMVAVELTTMAV